MAPTQATFAMFFLYRRAFEGSRRALVQVTEQLEGS